MNKKKIKKIIITILIILLVLILICCFGIDMKKKMKKDNDYNKMLEKIQNGEATSKEIEDFFVKNKNSEEAKTIYYYDSAKYYAKSSNEEKIKGMSNNEKEKYYIMRISPEYNGTLSNEIIEFGISLFGSKEEWVKQYEIGKQINERQNKMYNGDYEEAKKIYKYIENKYDKFYEENGKEANDEYSSKLFEEVSSKFGITILEANDIWENLIFNVGKVCKSTSISSSTTKNNTSSTIHYCEVTNCFEKGIYKLERSNGKTEYYCYKHYNQMVDIVNMLIGY